jgi:flagellar biosynthesis protein FliQ
MTDTDVLNIVGKALVLAAKLAGPPLIAVLVVGLIVSLMQAIFQVQDQALVFVPKILAAVIVLTLGGAWMLDSMNGFVEELWGSIPALVQDK